MDTDVREAAERLMKPEPVDDGAGMWRQAKRITTDYQDVARHVLAEIDETLADEEFFRSLGFTDENDILVVRDRNGELAVELVVAPKDMTVLVIHSMIATTVIITDPTRGQVLTALRLFGTPTGGTK